MASTCPVRLMLTWASREGEDVMGLGGEWRPWCEKRREQQTRLSRAEMAWDCQSFVDLSGHYSNLPLSILPPTLPTMDWCRQVHDLHQRLSGAAAREARDRRSLSGPVAGAPHRLFDHDINDPVALGRAE